MSNECLKQLLKEYDKKRNKAIHDANLKKQEIYSKNPRLEEIEREITSISISVAKSILQTSNKNLLKDLNSKKEILNIERNNILKALNIDYTFFEPQFECKLCNDTGYITNNFSTEMCNCLKQKLFDMEYNNLNSYDLKNQIFDNFSYEYYSDKIDNKYNSTISPRDNIECIKKICLTFIKNFDNPDEKNLLFTGNTGLGKTFLSSCIANELLRKGKTVLYQTAPVMLDSVINYRLGKSNNNIVNHLLNVDLLIIDDLGTESMNSMKFAELFTILNTRLLTKNNKITKTIISTNLSLQNLSSLYGERIISRLIGSYNICYFFGQDIRLIKKGAYYGR